MTKTVLLALILLCCSAWMVAQTTPDQSGGSTGGSGTSGTSSGQAGSSTGQAGTQTDTGSGSQANSGHGMNGNETTISGCLMSSGGNYMITDSTGTQYQLAGDTSKLSSHVNQQVQVKGMASGSGASASGSGSMNSGSSSSTSSASTGTQGTGSATSGSSQTFTVSKVKKISDSCSSASK